MTPAGRSVSTIFKELQSVLAENSAVGVAARVEVSNALSRIGAGALTIAKATQIQSLARELREERKWDDGR
jgi:hypothetical protein